MLILYNILLLILGFVFISWLWNRRKYYYMAYKIPGPVGLPFIGTALHFKNKEDILNVIENWKNVFGNVFFLFLGTKPYLYVNDPEIIEQIFNSNDAIQKTSDYGTTRDFLGDSLFVSGTQKWMHNRKFINKAFTHKTLIGLIPFFNNQGRIVKNEIIKKYVGKGECCILDEVSTCALYTTMMTTMGNEENTFESNETLWLVNLAKTIQNIIVQSVFDPILQLNPVHPFKKKFNALTNEFRQFTEQVIEKRFDMLTKSLNKSSEEMHIDDDNITKKRTILIDYLYEFYKNNDFTMADVKAEAGTIMFAAFETTSYTLYNCLLLLAMNPKYQDRLYEEIMSVCPEDDIEVTYEHIRQMPYSEMVLNETMRVISTVAIVARQLNNDMILKNGLFLAKGINIVVDLFHLHRDQKIWGSNSLQFNPYNFLKENIKSKNHFSFMPFTKGIRNCVGWRYAMFSLQILLVHIIKMYEVKTKWKLEDLKYIMSVTVTYKKYPTLEFNYRNKM